jgi:inosine-uridine nucleoside N-ribohydrolase
MIRRLFSVPPVLLVLAMAAGACTTEQAPPPTVPESTIATSATPSTTLLALDGGARGRQVIVDYSPTVSDAGALLYLLSHPDVDVVAITLPVTGEAGCELGIAVTLGILVMFERQDIPVACDSEVPTDAEQWPAEFLTGQEALTFGLPDIDDAVADTRPAHQLIADVVADADEPVTLVAVAPLTNVARALDGHPEVVDGLERVVIMGGNLDAPGNVGAADAEWNFWIDVPAAARVLGSGVPITLVPLDATNDVPVPSLWQSVLEEAEQSEPVEYLTALVRVFPAVTSGFWYLWDELAALVATGEDMVVVDELSVMVDQQPGPEYGNVVRDPAGSPVLVATGVPVPDDFYALFLSTLAGSPIQSRTQLDFDEVSAPTSVGSDSPPEEVMAYWLVQAFAGDVEAAGAVVADGAAWVGLGATPDDFVEGSGPYEASEIEIACTSDETVVLCDVTWTDLWIEPNPDVERGGLRVGAEVADGMIVAFTEFGFDEDIVAAFGSHTEWVAIEQPEQFARACGTDPASRACSELLVATVADWVANR